MVSILRNHSFLGNTYYYIADTLFYYVHIATAVYSYTFSFYLCILDKVEVLVISDRYVPAKLDTGTHIGKTKGIQGQHNSCYIDATLFGMFAFSDVFDDLFLDRCVANTEIEKKKDEIQDIIQKKIVYPLRELVWISINSTFVNSVTSYARDYCSYVIRQ